MHRCRNGLMFGLMHLNIGQFFYASIIGVLLGLIVMVSESIIPAMIVHFTNNFLNTYFDFASYNNWPGANIFDLINSFRYNNSPIIVFAVSLLIVMVVLIGIIYIIKRLFIERKLVAMRDRLRYKVLQDYYFKNWEQGNETPIINNEQIDAMIMEMQNDWFKLMAEHKDQININNMEFLNDVEIDDEKPTLRQKIFFYGALVLAALVTVFTFIWGIL